MAAPISLPLFDVVVFVQDTLCAASALDEALAAAPFASAADRLRPPLERLQACADATLELIDADPAAPLAVPADLPLASEPAAVANRPSGEHDAGLTARPAGPTSRQAGASDAPAATDQLLERTAASWSMPLAETLLEVADEPAAEEGADALLALLAALASAALHAGLAASTPASARLAAARLLDEAGERLTAVIDRLVAARV